MKDYEKYYLIMQNANLRAIRCEMIAVNPKFSPAYQSKAKDLADKLMDHFGWAKEQFDLSLSEDDKRKLNRHNQIAGKS
jgi:hypothetical protein